MYTICITGSRYWRDKDIIRHAIEQCIAENALSYSDPNTFQYQLVQGGAKGADLIAQQVGWNLGKKVITVEADWSLGKKAGMLRNREMLDAYKPDILIAFPRPDSIGTIGCINEAIKRQIPIIIRYEPR